MAGRVGCTRGDELRRGKSSPTKSDDVVTPAHEPFQLYGVAASPNGHRCPHLAPSDGFGPLAGNACGKGTKTSSVSAVGRYQGTVCDGPFRSEIPKTLQYFWGRRRGRRSGPQKICRVNPVANLRPVSA